MFRGSIAPASLKGSQLSQLRTRTRAVPGLYCPGLIEGGELRCSQGTTTTFRGSIAPASLKGSLTRLENVRLVAVPGLYCPGLIEGARENGHMITRPAPFRGSIAPASLKDDP